jgi:nucleotide-binding universal stress UspA family protein
VARVSRFQTLLVPHDFSVHSEAALEAAIDLAQGLGARVALVHVYHRPVTMFEPYGILPVEPVLTEIPEAARQRLDEELEKVVAAGVKGQARVREGLPVDGILDEASECGADLIVMGTHGHTGIPHALLGSVAERTVRLAPCPVLTVKSG